VIHVSLGTVEVDRVGTSRSFSARHRTDQSDGVWEGGDGVQCVCASGHGHHTRVSGDFRRAVDAAHTNASCEDASSTTTKHVLAGPDQSRPGRAVCEAIDVRVLEFWPVVIHAVPRLPYRGTCGRRLCAIAASATYSTKLRHLVLATDTSSVAQLLFQPAERRQNATAFPLLGLVSAACIFCATTRRCFAGRLSRHSASLLQRFGLPQTSARSPTTAQPPCRAIMLLYPRRSPIICSQP
jgi:hypothetical protein